MTLVERLNQIAIWLSREAQRRSLHRPSKEQGVDFAEVAGSVLVLPRRPEDVPEVRASRWFASVSRYPGKRWVLLALSRAILGGSPSGSIPIVVHFGYNPALDVRGEPSKRPARRKKIREALRRASSEGSFSGHALCIDSHTTTNELREQLAICLAREGIADKSTRAILGLLSKNPVTPSVGSRLVESFIDPAHPRSYAAYKRKLRLNVVGPQEASGVMQDSRSVLDEGESDETGRMKMRRFHRYKTPSDYSVRQAAELLAIPLRTLYQQLRERQPELQEDNFGRIRIPATLLEQLREEESQKQSYRRSVLRIAQKDGIQVASARRRLKRRSGKMHSRKDLA